MKKSEVPTEGAPSKWEVFKFHAIGWMVCVITGNIWKYAALVAQAKHETGFYRSRQFKEGRNAFGMTYPDPYASGAMEGADGQMCRYNSWWKCWRGRLAWDDRHGVLWGYNSLREYATAVQQAGYNPDPAYVDRWLDVYKANTSWLVRMVNAPVEPGGWFGKLRVWFWLFMLIALLVTLAYLCYRWKAMRRGK